MVGISINLCDLIGRRHNNAGLKGVCMLETVKLIVVCLHISSDQQVLQALSVKNDLVIAVYFAISCLTALVFLGETETCHVFTLLGSASLLVAYGYTAKSYGIICIVPFVVLGAIKLRDTRTALKINLNCFDGLQPIKLPSWDATFILYILSTFLVIFLIMFTSFINERYSSLEEYQISVAHLLNRYSNPFSYVQAAFLNFLRFLLNFLAYPYSTILKSQATSPDDYWLGLSPLVKLLSNQHAIAKGYTYGLIRYRSEEVSLTGPLVQLVALISLISLAYCLVLFNRGNGAKSTYLSSLRSVLEIKGILLIVVSSVGSAFLIFGMLSYHNWYVKYMAFAYLCLLPVLSWVLVFNIVEICSYFHVTSKQLAQSPLTIFLKTLLMLVALALFALSVLTYSRYFSLKYPYKDISDYRLYDDYLYSRGRKTPESRNGLLSQFSEKRETRIGLCFGEETPTLAPLLELSKQNISPDKVGFYSLKSKTCSIPVGVHKDEKIIILP